VNTYGSTVGFVTWAHLSEETEQRLLTTMDASLHLSEWNEGPALWLRCFHLPDGLRREGMRLCLDILFPDAASVRLCLRRKGVISAVELDRPVIERLSRLIP
jgi:hemolysin-activating ACP:hemolysin acyltransferase